MEDGAVIHEGYLDGISVKPGETVVYQMPMPFLNREEGVNYHLNLLFRLNEDSEYEKAGYIQAMEQLAFEMVASKKFVFDESLTMSVYEKKMVMEVASADFNATISKTSGDITSYRINDYEILRKPVKLNLWRAETDNDRGLSNFDNKYRRFAIDETYKKAMDSYSASGFKIDKGDKLVTVSFIRKVKGMRKGVATTYTFDGTGNVEISIACEPTKEMTRLGTTMAFSKDWSELMYYGR